MKKLLLVAILAGLLITPNVFAFPITSGSGSFQSWGPADLNETPPPYWDNASADGASLNIGYYISSGAGGPGAFLNYWGTSGGNPDPSFYFNKANDNLGTASLKLEIAGNAGSNVFGWYDRNTRIVDPANIIFNGVDSAPLTAFFTPSADFGFFFQTEDATFFTESDFSPHDLSNQHFAFFLDVDGESYWVGMEDTLLASGDKDFNDMILRLSPANAVPEPAMMLLLGTGLLGIWVYARRRFKK